MKIILNICFVLLFQINMNAQSDTVKTSADFYPLQIGNKWLYKTSSYEVGTIPNISYHRKEVIGDTLMGNGKMYFILKEGGPQYYERFDSTTNQIIRYNDWQCSKTDNPIYSLSYVPNDTIDWFYCDELPTQVFYNEGLDPDSSMIEIRRDFLVYYEEGFRKHLGLFYRDVYEVSYSTTVLIGAEINGKIWGTLTDIDEQDDLEYEFNLSQNYPNPFNPTTTLKFSIPKVETQHAVSLRIYDVLGREVQTLINKEMLPGSYEVTFDASDLPSGVYFYRLTAGNYSATKKMLLMK